MPRLLALIFGLSLVLRAWSISTVPPELFGDELDVGYQAYSLLKTGRDIYGQLFPTYLHSLSEWRQPLLIYFTVPSVAVFGLTEVGVRLPAVVLGSLGPVILSLLVYRTTKSRYIALLSAFFLAIMPWHIHYSRAAFEVVLLLNLILLATMMFQQRRLISSVLFFTLAFYTYSTALLFIPLWFLSLTLLTRKTLKFKSFIFPSIVLIILLAPLLSHILTGPARDRFGHLNVFQLEEIVARINSARSIETPPWSVIWHNKAESYFHRLLTHYFQAFSTEFLFIRGDPNHRHSIQFVGALLPITAPLLAIGLFNMVARRQYLWLFWLILAPLPAILTFDGGSHATRLFLMTAPLATALGMGMASIIRHKPRVFVPVFIILIAVYFSWVTHQYLFHYSHESWRWWHVGYQDSITALNRLSADYSRVFINNTYEPSLIRFLFYSQYSPSKFHRQFTLDQPLAEIVPGYDGFTLDGRVYFGGFTSQSHQDGIARHLLPGAIYLISQRDDVGGDWDWRVTPPSRVSVLHTTTNPYNEPLFYLVTAQP